MCTVYSCCLVSSFESLLVKALAVSKSVVVHEEEDKEMFLFQVIEELNLSDGEMSLVPGDVKVE